MWKIYKVLCRAYLRPELARLYGSSRFQIKALCPDVKENQFSKCLIVKNLSVSYVIYLHWYFLQLRLCVFWGFLKTPPRIRQCQSGSFGGVNR